MDSTDLYDHKIRESEGSSTCILQKHGVYFDIFSRFFYIMRNVVNKNKRKYVIIKCRHLISYKNKAKHFSHSLVLLDILLISCGFSVSRWLLSQSVSSHNEFFVVLLQSSRDSFRHPARAGPRCNNVSLSSEGKPPISVRRMQSS